LEQPAGISIEFHSTGIDNIPDLYGDIENPQLTVFFAGNQFMVVDDLLASFKKNTHNTNVFLSKHCRLEF
jgi:molybdate transport system substrate-binding protein